MTASEPSPIAAAIAWVSRITTIALAMVVPGVAGGWLDKRLGTSWIAAVGLAIGLVGGLAMLVNLTKNGPPKKGSRRPGS